MWVKGGGWIIEHLLEIQTRLRCEPNNYPHVSFRPQQSVRTLEIWPHGKTEGRKIVEDCLLLSRMLRLE